MGPVVYQSDGATTILAGSCDNSTYALDVNGKLIWKFATEGCVFGSPAVSQKGEVWTASFDRNIYGLRADGTLKCRFVTGQDGSIIWASPVISHDGSTVYIGSSGIPSDGKPPPPGFRTFYAINTEDCTQKWNYTTGMWVRSSAAVATDGAVVVGSYDDHVYCFEADGSIRWTFATGVFAGYASNHPPGFVLASPTIDEARQVVYVGATDKCFYAIDLKTGTKQWRFCTFGFVQSSAAVSPEDGSVVFGSNDNNVYSLHANNGSVKWIWRTDGWVQSSPVIDAERRAAVIGDAAGFVWALGW
jgi:outer membrane protein assembly factor BamB